MRSLVGARWVAAALSIAACGRSPSGLVDVTPEPAGSNCPAGGLAFSTGIDDDGDGALSSAEIDETQYVCDASGDSSAVLIRQDALAPGEQCPAGGVIVASGVDDDGDGVLSAGEVDSSTAVCNGQMGAMGTSTGSVLRLDVEPPGENCPNGGTAVRAGIDVNGDGDLDDPEIATTRYVCHTGITGPHPRIFSAEGTTSECYSEAVYATIPDMELTFDLDADYVVLTLFDMNVEPSSLNSSIAVRLALDGAPESHGTHVSPNDASEVEHLSLSRIDLLAAGSHTLAAQWGDQFGGTVCNRADAADGQYGAGPWWARRITALAIPVASGVTSGMVSGSTDASYAADPYVTIPNLSIPITLASDAIVVTELDITVVVPNGNASVGLRLAVDGVSSAGSFVGPDGAGEAQHVHLFQMTRLAAGAHTLSAQWGEAARGTIQNTPGTAATWTRRLGYLAIPISTGVIAEQVAPETSIYFWGGEWSTIPSLAYDLELGFETSYVTLTQMAMTFGSNQINGAAAIRTMIDGAPDPRSVHANPNAQLEYEQLHLHRAAVLGPGPHRIEGQGHSMGTMVTYLPGAGEARRLGTLAIPLRGY